MYIAICALLPLLGGFASAFIKFKSDRARNIYIFIITCLTSIGAIAGALALSDKGIALFKLNDYFSCELKPDDLGRVFICLIAALWPLSTLYAFEYMEHEPRTGNFFVFYTMAYGVALLMALSRNLFTFYIFFECLTIVTLPLVEHGQNKEAYRAGRAYLIYLIGGASLGFAAMIIAHGMAQNGTAFVRGGLALSGSDTMMRVAFLLAFVGFGVKAALFPLCRWLPKASVAPTPVTALLHAVAVVNAGVFGVIRIAYYVFPSSAIKGSFAQIAVLLLSALTVLYGAVRALRESHIKRRLAWSTVSNLGYMLFAIGLLSDTGFTAGIAHMLFHSLMKIVLFFCAGAIMTKADAQDIHETGGLAKYMPFTFMAFTLSGAALAGIPPLIGFTSKYLIITSALNDATWVEIFGAVCLIASAILTAFYIFTIVVPAYFTKRERDNENISDMGLSMKLSVGAVCVLIILASAFSSQIISIIEALK